MIILNVNKFAIIFFAFQININDELITVQNTIFDCKLICDQITIGISRKLTLIRHNIIIFQRSRYLFMFEIESDNIYIPHQYQHHQKKTGEMNKRTSPSSVTSKLLSNCSAGFIIINYNYWSKESKLQRGKKYKVHFSK